ncbi:uncharacterized protein MELLADRAFT_106311 [Melampsora larici-populina 98AG31]|uniref:Secreted protein n=1 Tax=Melampsora larici-populina (strain 98AG31 / pathotype 3-4-7) TaxID=747676 RepID=F4RKZ0_MELLP|nr:uncharacterized protein MELLADRAFT_106311 [Melampsora larici-populina 98AG31]EGG06953.1 hypothetical protein MELLADRAFT_106311 [Melampsora larici-populina 98AG31]
MLSLSFSVLLASISWVSLATGQKVKIVSPVPGSPVVPGTTLNLTLEVDGDVCHQVALGFGLNSKPTDSKSLGHLLLGTLDTTKTPFDPSTKQLSYPLQIPATDKFTDGVTGPITLPVFVILIYV